MSSALRPLASRKKAWARRARARSARCFSVFTSVTRTGTPRRFKARTCGLSLATVTVLPTA